MRLIKELDARYMGTRDSPDKKRELDEKQKQYYEAKKDRKPELLKEIKDLQTICLELSNEKVQISKQTDQLVAAADQVRRCFEKLEQELNRFNKQLETRDEEVANSTPP
jgi:chromosome segregation ATPase